jgi:ABC-type multidrug transport system fused ATPase/permease subunit
MPVGDLVAFLGLLKIVNNAVDDLSRNVLPDWITATSGLQRIEELLQQTPDIVDRPDALALSALASQIALEHVSFSYTGEAANF